MISFFAQDGEDNVLSTSDSILSGKREIGGDREETAINGVGSNSNNSNQSAFSSLTVGQCFVLFRFGLRNLQFITEIYLS